MDKAELNLWLEALVRWRQEAQAVESMKERIYALKSCEANESYVLWRLWRSL